MMALEGVSRGNGISGTQEVAEGSGCCWVHLTLMVVATVAVVAGVLSLTEVEGWEFLDNDVAWIVAGCGGAVDVALFASVVLGSCYEADPYERTVVRKPYEMDHSQMQSGIGTSDINWFLKNYGSEIARESLGKRIEVQQDTQWKERLQQNFGDTLVRLDHMSTLKGNLVEWESSATYETRLFFIFATDQQILSHPLEHFLTLSENTVDIICRRLAKWRGCKGGLPQELGTFGENTLGSLLNRKIQSSKDLCYLVFLRYEQIVDGLKHFETVSDGCYSCHYLFAPGYIHQWVRYVLSQLYLSELTMLMPFLRLSLPTEVDRAVDRSTTEYALCKFAVTRLTTSSALTEALPHMTPLQLRYLEEWQLRNKKLDLSGIAFYGRVSFDKIQALLAGEEGSEEQVQRRLAALSLQQVRVIAHAVPWCKIKAEPSLRYLKDKKLVEKDLGPSALADLLEAAGTSCVSRLSIDQINRIVVNLEGAAFRYIPEVSWRNDALDLSALKVGQVAALMSYELNSIPVILTWIGARQMNQILHHVNYRANLIPDRHLPHLDLNKFLEANPSRNSSTLGAWFDNLIGGGGEREACARRFALLSPARVNIMLPYLRSLGWVEKEQLEVAGINWSQLDELQVTTLIGSRTSMTENDTRQQARLKIIPAPLLLQWVPKMSSYVLDQLPAAIGTMSPELQTAIEVRRKVVGASK